MTGEYAWLWWLVAAVGVVLLVLLIWVGQKGRPFTTGHVFRASRWSRGNRLLPTQVAIRPNSVVHYTPEWIGKEEETIHMAHVASVKIDTGLIFSDVHIETSGGSKPIICHGHTKGDAVKMKDLIERYQTEHYRGPAGLGSPVGPGPSSR